MCSGSHGAVIRVTIPREPPDVKKTMDHSFPAFDMDNIDERHTQ
jgi:hypothetical protein